MFRDKVKHNDVKLSLWTGRLIPCLSTMVYSLEGIYACTPTNMHIFIHIHVHTHTHTLKVHSHATLKAEPT